MAKRKTDTIKKTLPKAAQVQNYKHTLKQKRVSGTVRYDIPPFDETTNYPSASSANEYDAPRTKARLKSSKFSLDRKTIGIVITLLFALIGVIYKFALLEKSVEFLQKALSEIKGNITKIEDEHKKDYQHLNEKLVDFIYKNKK